MPEATPAGATAPDRPGHANAAPPTGYARAATAGTRWLTAQMLINKVVAALSMVVLAHVMTEEEIGLASIIIAASGMVTFLPIFVMGDILIAHQHHLDTVSRTARKVILLTTAVMVGLLCAAAPFIALWYDQYPFLPVLALLLFSALWPISDAVSVVPLTRLRVALRYREIAVISAVVQLAGTCLTMLWAVVRPSAAAIVVPQILTAMAMAISFAVAARKMPPLAPRSDARLKTRNPSLPRSITRRITREFGIASAAQYLMHRTFSGLPVIITSLYVTGAAIGQFGFAFTLVLQTSSLFVQQIMMILQPIFGRLRSDPTRQVTGFIRAIALMSAIAAPMSLLQAAVAEPLFILFFGERWLPAVPVFVAFSVAQASYVLTAPVMALLKAQGRFGTFFLWQVSQALVSLAVFPVAAANWGGIGVAWSNAALWFICVPIVTWIGSRGSGVRISSLIWSLIASWLTAGLIAIGTWLVWLALPGPRPIAAAFLLVVVAPAALLVALLSIRLTQPSVAREIAPAMSRILRRIPVAGPSLTAWFIAAR